MKIRPHDPPLPAGRSRLTLDATLREGSVGWSLPRQNACGAFSHRSVKPFPQRLKGAGFCFPAMVTVGLALKGLNPWLPGLSCPLRSLTGVPCPTCFLTRATSAALIGQWPTAVRLHAFGPLVAVALVWWSITAIRQRRFLPRQLSGGPLAAASVVLVAYWLGRLVVTFGLGWRTFPAFPSG